MRKELSGHHFDRNNDIIAAMDDFLEVLSAVFYKGWDAYAPQIHWTQWVNVEGGFLEK